MCLDVRRQAARVSEKYFGRSMEVRLGEQGVIGKVAAKSAIAGGELLYQVSVQAVPRGVLEIDGWF